VALDAASILSQIKSLEAQLGALKAQVKKLASQSAEPTYTFSELYGRIPEQGDISPDEIDAILYQIPLEQEDAH
jgi:hypothetical protein